MPTKSEPAPAPAATIDELKHQLPDTRKESSFPGIAERDVALVERIATDLATLARAMRKGDAKTAQGVYPRLMKLPREAERVRVIARRAFSRPTQE
jgi:hypothetical protein